MDLNASMSKKERECIFALFLKNKTLRFSEIQKGVNIRSNLLVYHLDQMVKDGLIEKKEDSYTLTAQSEQLIPFFNQMTGKELGALPVVLVAIINKGKICLLKRNKRPYQGYWGMIGGKVKMNESIVETALREAKEETNLDCEFESINAVVHERVKENSAFKHAFILFFAKARAKSDKFRECDEGKLEWFDLNNLNKNILIPSDYWMLTNFLNKKSDLKSVVMEEKDEKLVNMEEIKN